MEFDQYSDPRDSQDNFTAFKTSFKYYKRQDLNPSLDSVIDFNKASEFESVKEVEISGEKSLKQFPNIANRNELQEPSVWKAYEFLNVPGLYFILNLFSDEGKKRWCERALNKFSKEPQQTNLIVNHSQETINQAFENSNNIVEQNNITGWFNQKKQIKLLKTCPLWGLRWSTLGYHYNWTPRIYEANKKSHFPNELAEITKFIATLLNFENFIPEAGITNFYHVGQNISPHVDISEPHKQAPLISLSFGLPAIFLIGEDTLDVKPEALFLRNGDVIIMSGKSRLAYHSVPAILPQNNELNASTDFLSLYMAHTRININVRQVESDDLKLPAVPVPLPCSRSCK